MNRKQASRAVHQYLMWTVGLAIAGAMVALIPHRFVDSPVPQMAITAIVGAVIGLGVAWILQRHGGK